MANPQILADQLTLSHPGGQIMPPHYYLAPRIFRPSYGPAVHATVTSAKYRFDQVDALKHICLKQRSTIHNIMILKMQVSIGLDFNQDRSYTVYTAACRKGVGAHYPHAVLQAPPPRFSDLATALHGSRR